MSGWAWGPAPRGAPDRATTADGATHLARAAMRYGARLVRVSGDAALSGAGVHYDEAALPDPVTPYGAAKAAAETAIRLFAPAAVIARTSLLLGDGDPVRESFVHAPAVGRRRTETGPPGPLDVRLDSAPTQRTVRTALRGARAFLRRADCPLSAKAAGQRRIPRPADRYGAGPGRSGATGPAEALRSYLPRSSTTL
ncbi:sugar nucleotide-binding protein [Streptomyces sp. NPDC014733]|uniref:sugar nucleotide-binding protein n=1 Tax=Streptomyces sp. NPDC014733 TaxID=3364885 RepID=UPI0036F6CA54